MYNGMVAERDYFKNALGYSHGDVVHHEQELGVLREGIEQKQAEIADLVAAKEFAEAEVSVPTRLRPSQLALTSRLTGRIDPCQLEISSGGVKHLFSVGVTRLRLYVYRRIRSGTPASWTALELGSSKRRNSSLQCSKISRTHW